MANVIDVSKDETTKTRNKPDKIHLNIFLLFLFIRQDLFLAGIDDFFLLSFAAL